VSSVYEIVLARYATAPARLSGLYLNHHLYGELDGPAQTDYYVWIVRNGDRTILIDTGFSREVGQRRDKTVLHDVPVLWRRLGVDTKDAEVVLTHLHYDHVGNLASLSAPRVTLAASELDFWTSEASAGFLISYYAEPQDIDTVWRLHESGRVRTFTGELDLAPGIRLVEVGGHTPGQTMVLVDTRIGTVLLASDAVHFRKELAEDKPFAAVTDLPGLYRGLARVRQLVRDDEVVAVVTGHDPDELDGLDRLPGMGDHVGVIAPLGGGE
jgi:glyoxylase-like metal-dependent hydrolase (beta-lactamase superfamily II)